MPRTTTQIDKFAEKLINELPPHARAYPGEMSYVAIASRLIHKRLSDYFQGTGVEPPSVAAIRLWFYDGCPKWAIAILANLLSEKVPA
jgi:hypothetical protein